MRKFKREQVRNGFGYKEHKWMLIELENFAMIFLEIFKKCFKNNFFKNRN